MSFEERAVQGERIVVTGGTDGIGKEIARGLVRRGAAVTLVARNPAKAAGVVEELLAEAGATGGVDVVVGDLGDLASVRRAAAELAERYERIDVLVNNAGIHATESRTTVDGFDLTMATNHLGPFLLTNLLLDRVVGRIVTTASEAHRSAPRPRLDRLAAETSYGVAGSEIHYSQSKLMNILFTKELARRLEGTGVTANCWCPGLVNTSLAGESKLASAGLAAAAAVRLAAGPGQGARLGLRLVLDSGLEGVTGKFFTSTPGLKFLPAMPAVRDEDYQRKAWERSAELVGL